MTSDGIIWSIYVHMIPYGIESSGQTQELGLSWTCGSFVLRTKERVEKKRPAMETSHGPVFIILMYFLEEPCRTYYIICATHQAHS